MGRRSAASRQASPPISSYTRLAPEYAPIATTLPGFETTSWTAVGVRAGTPKEICDKIEADTRTICQGPMLRERLAALVAETSTFNAAETTAYIASERDKGGKLITDIKLKLE